MFIVIEGPDGSGKSTQALLLAHHLAQHGEVNLTCEPTNEGVVGKRIRELLVNDEKISNVAMAYLFAADRNEHNVEISDSLDGGGFVVCDRYWLSSMAYQADINFSMNKVWELNKRFMEPDLTIYVDVSIDVAQERMAKRGSLERYEWPDQQFIVHKKYFEAKRFLLAKDQRIVDVDGAGDTKEVFSRILDVAKPTFEAFGLET